ncbi:MAG TPA: TetR/AcrR family transcriptional regulator [Hellea balneolensis]|uniref:TetR/AcrR family transcriptional regulator n=1 Tax=Hellea balneolensis TaxID=287478 RepID=A0A7C5QWB9_9PROT|nr:TetR/AcrR family transcriptional regulator [Hellea balneolensis]
MQNMVHPQYTTPPVEPLIEPKSAKGRILGVAARQFSDKGYEATTVRDLAAEIGILSGSIFHHFKSKEEILYSLMLDVTINMANTLQQAVSAAPTQLEKIRALVQTELSFIHGPYGPAATVLVYEWRSLSKHYRTQILSHRDKYDQLWIQTLTQAKADGLTDIDAKILHQIIHGALAWTVNWYDPKGKLSLEGLSDTIVNLAVHHQVS